MSSSRRQQQQPPSNNPNNNNNNNPTYSNQFVDYQTDESINSQRYDQQQMSDHRSDNRGQSHENDVFEQIYPFQEDADDDLPNEIVAALNTKDRIQTNTNDEDESVFSDVVQNAFKKYQNEQEELYAQMEECWNYMSQDNNLPDSSKSSIGQQQLNPDATEFKPSWLQSTNEGFLKSSQTDEQQKKY